MLFYCQEIVDTHINPEPLTPNLVTEPLKRVTFWHQYVIY